MERTPSKLNINVQIVAIIVLVFFCGVLFILRNGEKNERLKVQKKLSDTIKVKDQIQKDLDEIKTAKTDLESKITNLEGEIKKLNDSIVKEIEEKGTLKASLDAKEAALSDLNARLEKERGEKQSLADRLTKTQKDFDSLKSQVDQLTKTKSELDEKVKELSSGESATGVKEGGVELEKIVVSSESKLKGDVVVVNNNLGFVVINLGSKDGITVGTILGIYRSDSFLGEVQVEKVYESICSANIPQEWANANFKEGDKATIVQ